MSEGISDPQGLGHTAGPMARRPPLPPRAQLQLSLVGRGRHEPRPSTRGLVPDPLPVLVAAVTAGLDVTSKSQSKRLTPGRWISAPGHTPGWGQETGELPVAAEPVVTGAAPAGADAPALPSHAGGDCGVHGAGGGCRRGGHGDGTADSVRRGRVAAGPDHECLPLPRRGKRVEETAQKTLTPEAPQLPSQETPGTSRGLPNTLTTPADPAETPLEPQTPVPGALPAIRPRAHLPLPAPHPRPPRLLLSAGRHDHAEHRRHQWIPRVSVTAACLGQNKGTAFFLALRLRVLFCGSWGRRHGVA
ncbi:claudin domain-containing protein 2 isoform X1 [Pan troglodytes]|uniref:claudin domain-containing protein 2 isoform X1 n=1 Tax=Pan troglodytes TaxID=9598 RepID=UPI0023F10A9B|nr:claudin domain-containing protein 2 isoform X1 [Pan troglodytes]